MVRRARQPARPLRLGRAGIGLQLVQLQGGFAARHLPDRWADLRGGGLTSLTYMWNEMPSASPARPAQAQLVR